MEEYLVVESQGSNLANFEEWIKNHADAHNLFQMLCLKITKRLSSHKN